MIEFGKVTKKYGDQIALDNITMKIDSSGIYCLLGRNGAGKTTFMKLVSGYMNTTEGKIKIDGKVISTAKMPESVNFIENNSPQFNMKVGDLIATAASLQDDFDKEFAQEMVKKFNLNEQKKYKQLSFGMKTMLTTILTLANNSGVILLDEPTLGFDAIMRDQFNSLLLESYSKHPRIIIVSTHMIDEIAKVTECLIIIDKGKILLQTTLEDIDEHAYSLTGRTDVMESIIKDLNCIGKTNIGGMMVAQIYGDRIKLPKDVTLDRVSLQDFFIAIVGGKNNE